MPFSNRLLWIGFIVVLFLAVLFMTLFYSSTLTFLPRMYYNVTWSQCTLPTLSRTHLPLTALASYAGSGNTWLRHLVQSATGIITGSVYKGDNDLLENGFPGETITNSSVILIKTHIYGVKERAKYTRAVLLMRNPYDAMTAEFNRRHGGHIGHASDLDFKSNWTKYLSNVSDSWMRMNHDWLQFSGPLYVTRYEDFIQNPVKEVKNLMSFLDAPVPFRDHCVLENLNGKHKRKRMNKKRNNLFPMTVRKKIDADIAKIEHEISKTTMNRKP